MKSYYTSDEVVRILNLSGSEFRSCLRAALFSSFKKTKPSQFTFQDLLLLKTTKRLCEAHIPVARIRRMLASVKRQLPEDQQLSNVKIYADGRRVVVWDGAAHWQPDSGQFLFDFEPNEGNEATKVRLLGKPAKAVGRTAEQWLTLARELESHSPEEARQAYREAIQLDEGLFDAHLNLGFLYHGERDLEQAERSYRNAILCAPDESLGHFNLAVLLQEKGDGPGAIEAYRRVVTLQPSCADAHYHLGTLCEAEGMHREAIQHYAAAKKTLQGHGARSRLRVLRRPLPPNPSA